MGSWHDANFVITGTTCSTTSDDEVGIMTILGFHCRKCSCWDNQITKRHSENENTIDYPTTENKANLRDLIAATGLAISNWIQIVNFYRPCDREIWWMTLKNNRTLFLYYVKLCASFQIHWWNQTGFTVQKRSIRVEIGGILSLWPWNLMDDIGKR